MREAASHDKHRLILECYHPSAKYYTPYLFCDYISTPGLDTADSPESTTVGAIGALSTLYSYFRPVKPTDIPSGGWPYRRQTLRLGMSQHLPRFARTIQSVSHDGQLGETRSQTGGFQELSDDRRGSYTRVERMVSGACIP
jgi:hypothetical protein